MKNTYQTALSFSRARCKSTLHSPRKTLSPSGQKSQRVTSIARFIKLSPSTPEKSNVAFQIGFWLGSATAVFKVIWSALKCICNIEPLISRSNIPRNEFNNRKNTQESTELFDYFEKGTKQLRKHGILPAFTAHHPISIYLDRYRIIWMEKGSKPMKEFEIISRWGNKASVNKRLKSLWNVSK